MSSTASSAGAASGHDSTAEQSLLASTRCRIRHETFNFDDGEMVNMSGLSDKVAIVTGASKAIGSGIATAAIAATSLITTEVLIALRSSPG